MEEGICAEGGVNFTCVEHSPCIIDEIEDTGAVFVIDIYYVALEIGFVEVIDRCTALLVVGEGKGSTVFMIDVSAKF